MADTFGVVDVKLEVTIAASPTRVWAALVDETSHWWRKDFYTSPKTKRFVIEPRLGGKAYEDFGDGAGLVWYSVIGFEPPTSLRLAGYLFPEYGGPANCLLHITLEPKGKETLLKLNDCVFGRPNDDCGTSLTDGWKLLFEDALKAYVEGAKA